MIDVAMVKAQSRIGNDAEDALVQNYIDSAIAYAEMHCDRKIVDTPTSDAEMALTADVQQAIIMLVAHWYITRETTAERGTTEVPHGFEQILRYRKRF